MLVWGSSLPSVGHHTGTFPALALFFGQMLRRVVIAHRVYLHVVSYSSTRAPLSIFLISQPEVIL